MVLPFIPPHQPFSEGGVAEHPAAIGPPRQERRQLLQTLRELGPLHCPAGHSAGIDHLKKLNGKVKFFPTSDIQMFVSQ